MSNNRTLITRSKLVLAGFTAVGHEGEHQIESPLKAEGPALELFERGQEKLVPVDDAKTAVCIDGRCALCTAQDLPLFQAGQKTPIKPSVVAKVPGGLFHFATLMAVLGDAAIVQGAKSFVEAREIVSKHLESLGYADKIHTSITGYASEIGTECGAKDKVVPAITAAANELELLQNDGGSGSLPIADTLALLHGVKEGGRQLHAKVAAFREIADKTKQIASTDFFAGFSPVKDRDELMESHPENVEILESDADHPTHLHVEKGIAVNMVDDTTIDRDTNNGDLFCYDRWMTQRLAKALAGTTTGEDRLVMAGDYVTLAIADQLVAPGMPAALYTPAE